MKQLLMRLCPALLAIVCTTTFAKDQVGESKPVEQTFEDYHVIIDTNIFVQKKDTPKRNPTEKTDEVSPQNESVKTPDVDTYLLFGIILENDDQFTAMIEHKQSKSLKSLHIGDKLDLFDITAMTISSVVFTMPDNRTVELFVGQSLDANGNIGHVNGLQSPTAQTALSSDKELSILEKMRQRRDSQLKKDQPDAK